jgi:Amt family ammonium transporter
MNSIKKRTLILLGVFALFSSSLLASEGSTIDSGATSWMLTSTALVLLMVPGLAMFYGGLVRTKNVLGTMMHSFAAMGVMTIYSSVCVFNVSR